VTIEYLFRFPAFERLYHEIDTITPCVKCQEIRKDVNSIVAKVDDAAGPRHPRVKL